MTSKSLRKSLCSLGLMLAVGGFGSTAIAESLANVYFNADYLLWTMNLADTPPI